MLQWILFQNLPGEISSLQQSRHQLLQALKGKLGALLQLGQGLRWCVAEEPWNRSCKQYRECQYKG